MSIRSPLDSRGCRRQNREGWRNNAFRSRPQNDRLLEISLFLRTCCRDPLSTDNAVHSAHSRERLQLTTPAIIADADIAALTSRLDRIKIVVGGHRLHEETNNLCLAMSSSLTLGPPRKKRHPLPTDFRVAAAAYNVDNSVSDGVGCVFKGEKKAESTINRPTSVAGVVKRGKGKRKFSQLRICGTLHEDAATKHDERRSLRDKSVSSKRLRTTPPALLRRRF